MLDNIDEANDAYNRYSERILGHVDQLDEKEFDRQDYEESITELKNRLNPVSSSSSETEKITFASKPIGFVVDDDGFIDFDEKVSKEMGFLLPVSSP